MTQETDTNRELQIYCMWNQVEQVITYADKRSTLTKQDMVTAVGFRTVVQVLQYIQVNERWNQVKRFLHDKS